MSNAAKDKYPKVSCGPIAKGYKNDFSSDSAWEIDSIKEYKINHEHEMANPPEPTHYSGTMECFCYALVKNKMTWKGEFIWYDDKGVN